MPADSKPPAKGATAKEDVEMADVEVKIEEETPKGNVVQAINAELQSISHAVPNVDLRTLARLQLAAIKRQLTGPILKRSIEAYITKDDEMKDLMLLILQKEASQLDEPLEKSLKDSPFFKNPSKLPEVSFFFATLLLDYMLGPLKMSKQNCEKFVSQLVMKLGNLNRRTLDFLGSKIYHYFARIFNDTDLIRNDLLAIYRTACLRRDTATQATVLNLILRNYINYNLVDQASQFLSKTTFPENRSNAEYARYLFYIGRMRSIQLLYSEAHSKLMQAIRKAPLGSGKALGFKVQAWKFALTVELLMGEIPERKNFTQPELRAYLKPYEFVTAAVRGGSIPEFEQVVNKYRGLFQKDGTLTLISRLRYNVIKTGLRKINVSYSRISLKDICTKLGLESVEDAAGICGKAIADGVIHASLDYESMALVSKSSQDVYLTNEPQQQLHKRIAFCLQLTNECTKSMEYPSARDKKEEESDPTKENRERDDFIKEVEEDDIDML